MLISSHKKNGLAFVAVLALALTPIIGFSQDYSPPEQAAPVEVSDQQVQSFVEAQTKIVEIQQQYQSRMASAETPESQQEMVAEANEKMISAVETSGLSVEEYNQIITAAESDTDLQQRISEASPN